MENINTMLGIFASLIAIISAFFSWSSNKKVKKIYKSQAGDNSISNSGDRNKISQRNVKKGDR